MNYLFIVDPKKFTGHALNLMPMVEEHEINQTQVHYSSLTFEEYNNDHGGGLVALTEEVFDRDYYKPYLASLCAVFEEITEERYLYNLNVLPPARWHKFRGIEIFFVGECYTGNLYTCCIQAGKKFYSALRPINIKDEELFNQIVNLNN